MLRYNSTPFDSLINEAFSPMEVERIIDRVITGYMFSLLKDRESVIARDEVIEEMCLLVEIRARARECAPVCV